MVLLHYVSWHYFVCGDVGSGLRLQYISRKPDVLYGGPSTLDLRMASSTFEGELGLLHPTKEIIFCLPFSAPPVVSVFEFVVQTCTDSSRCKEGRFYFFPRRHQ